MWLHIVCIKIVANLEEKGGEKGINGMESEKDAEGATDHSTVNYRPCNLGPIATNKQTINQTGSFRTLIYVYEY